MKPLKEYTPQELLVHYTEVLSAMREREIIRSDNNPTGDLAEYLFCKAFNWLQAKNSEKSYDAVDSLEKRYQIKGRRITSRNKSRQLSAIRDFEGFDMLAVVLFKEDFSIQRAALIPSNVARDNSNYIAHTNSYRIMAPDTLFEKNNVEDVTSHLRFTMTENMGKLL
ncbi:MAG: hypothetical protein AAGG79_06035 [Pseudomonadota bacterium]